MSSHHFVKEGQEPALVILEAYSLEAVEPLLEWAPLVVVSDTVINDVVRWGTKIDVVVSTKEKIVDLDVQLSDQGPIKFLEYTSGDLLTTVFQFLLGSDQKGATVISNSFTEAITAAEPFGKVLNISILTSSIRWSFISVGHFKKWLPAGSTLFIKSKQPVSFQGESGGMQSVEDHISATADGIISLDSMNGFWVGEPV